MTLGASRSPRVPGFHARVGLANLPPFERRYGQGPQAPEFGLLWQDDPLLEWSGSIYESASPLALPQVPAGHLRLVRRPENLLQGYPDESWTLVREFELVAGGEVRVELP